MCQACICVEIKIKDYFLQLNYKQSAINKYIVLDFPNRCLKKNKNYLRNYIHFKLEQMPLAIKCNILNYVDQI